MCHPPSPIANHAVAVAVTVMSLLARHKRITTGDTICVNTHALASRSSWPVPSLRKPWLAPQPRCWPAAWSFVREQEDGTIRGYTAVPTFVKVSRNKAYTGCATLMFTVQLLLISMRTATDVKQITSYCRSSTPSRP